MADGFYLSDSIMNTDFDPSSLFSKGDYGSIGWAVGDKISGGGNYDNILGSTINDYISSGSTGSGGLGGFNFGSIPFGTIFNTLGRLGSGIGTGIASYQSQKQPDYIPYTQWLGNGLAKTGYINNKSNKDSQLDQLFGAGNVLSNTFGKGFSLFGNGKYNNNNLDDLDTDKTYDNVTYGLLANAANNPRGY